MPRREDIQHILVIGSGPIVIGQACEFDYSGTQACRVLKDEGIRVVDTRHEQSAGHAAEGYGRLTRKCGVAVVTAGPGVTDVGTAVATAYQNASPMLVIGGAAPLSTSLMGALQEIPGTVEMMRPITTWSASVPFTKRIPDYLAQAFRVALTGRYGPVFLEIPSDILFGRVADILPVGGRFYLQTMVFGRKMVPLDQIGTRAPRDSDGWYLALLGCQFPGSWLPSGPEQIIRCAEPHFELVSSISGRLDYIETIRRWGTRIGAPSLRKTLLKLELLPRWLTSAEFRLGFTSGVGSNRVCFERELLDHYRIVLEKPG